jgi:hypothetical protein
MEMLTGQMAHGKLQLKLEKVDPSSPLKQASSNHDN